MMRVELRFSDGEVAEIEVGLNETILEGAEREGIVIRNQCRSGSCSTCIGTVVAGEIEHDPTVSASLLPVEFESGCRLSCIAHPNTPSVITYAYPSVDERDQPIRFQMLVDAIEKIALDVVRIKARGPKKLDFTFSPGQYLKFRVPGTNHWRRFSMSSAPADLNKMEFLVRLLPDGEMSNYLRYRAAPGEFIEVEGPGGEFQLHWSDKKHLLIGGGTGVAPLLSMLRHMIVSGRKRPTVLLSAGFNSPDQLFYDHIGNTSKWFSDMETRISLLSGASNLCKTCVGNPVEAIRAEDVNGGDVVAYLCGPPPMVFAAREHLASMGVPLQSIYYENFTPAESD